jgi:hypothetical protein
MRVLLLAAALSALAIPVGADHCAGWTTTTHGYYGIPVIEAEGRYVLVECHISDIQGCELWGYRVMIVEESNGIPGLQHVDELHDDTCHGLIAADRIVF